MATQNLPLSDKIEFDRISREQFREFVDVLAEADENAYFNESRDNFLDLYNYWNEIFYERGGEGRFNQKLANNKAKAGL